MSTTGQLFLEQITVLYEYILHMAEMLFFGLLPILLLE